jgi:hypothetical protein
VRERGGVQAESVDAGIDLAHEFPLAFQRVGIPVADRVHTVLEQLVLDLAAGRGGEVDIPGALVVMQFRRPDQFAAGTRIGLVPDIGGRCVAQAFDAGCAAQLDAVVLRHRGGEVVVAVAMTEDIGIGTLLDQGSQFLHRCGLRQ